MRYGDPISAIKGVGESTEKKFKKIGIYTIDDLLRFFPRKYQDYSSIIKINQLKPGKVTLKGYFKQTKGRYIRAGLHITEAIFSDETGSVKVIWFNQPYRASSIKNNEEYYVSGEFDFKHSQLSVVNPSIELASSFNVSTARIVPIYPQLKGIKSNEIRRLLKLVIPKLKPGSELLPSDIREQYNLLAKKEAYSLIHFPENQNDIDRARQTLGFEEIFELVLAHMASRHELIKSKALPVPFRQNLAKEFVANTPFKLTPSQKLTVWEIYQDIHKDKPMNRLVEGDVGSGKTVVAAMAIAMVVSHGFQSALMAPTELLARQHANTLSNFLKPLGQADTICLLTGSMSKKQKQRAAEKIKSGLAKCIIGTHSLIQESIQMDNLAIVIVDEQHRFGVDQRKNLLKKAGHMPHMLSMTATPIPRSLALTVYGDLDISILRHKPQGRKSVDTSIVTITDRNKIYKQIDDRIARHEQAFVVCPLIEESSSLRARSAKKVYEELSKGVFKDRKVEILHGRQKNDKKQKIMEEFVEGKIDVLVSTTVIEVGVDVPNASIMVIEGPERFGLAQIHQLRGRVGRGSKPAHCYLMLSDNKSPTKRLKAIEQTNDGFKLAELDLEIRGPGAIYGRAQHGQLDMKIATLSDQKLIKQARQAASQCINEDPSLVQYGELKNRIEKLQKITHLN